MRTHRRLVSVLTFLAALGITTGAGTLAGQGRQPQAERRRVVGRVTAQDSNEPLGAATVTVVGTALGTTTGEDGRFALAVPAGDVSLRIRRIGYKPRVVPAPPADGEVAVTLERDVLLLETQVVTGAATTVARRNAAVDIPIISGEELNRAPAPTIENALAGKVAGVLVEQNSGAPGGGLQVQIRGVSSINGTSAPLYVVDGVIVANDVIQTGINAVTGGTFGQRPFPSNTDNAANRLADLNPADIEHIEVLKGAAATAIYGSKAAPGVILITTKQGGQGRTRYQLQQRLGTHTIARKIGLRRFTLEEAKVYDKANNPTPLSDAELERNYQRCGGYCDFEQQLFGGGELSSETNLSARGGSQRTGFYVSLQDKYDNGLQRNTGFRRQSLRVNLTHQATSRLSAQLNTNLAKTVTRRGATGNDNFDVSPYVNFATTPSFIDLRPTGGAYPRTPYGVGNPFQTADLLSAPVTAYRFLTGGSVTYAALATDRQTLSLRLDAGLDHTSERDELYSPTELFTEQAKSLPGTAVNQSGTLLYRNATLSATHSWVPASRRFTATTSAGLQREQRYRQTAYVEAEGLLPGQSNIDRGSKVNVQEQRARTNDLAFFAQEELLTLGERLLLTAGVRGERSTNNGDVTRLFYYPKSSVSLRLPRLGVANELKLRAAFGQSGNQPLYGQKFTTLAPSVYDGRNALRPAAVYGAPGIRPERQTELEGGVDAELFDSRVSLTTTVYRKRIDDLLLNRTLPASSGFGTQLINGGQLVNTGLELALAVTPVQTRDLSVVSRVTFARNRSEVTELPVPAFNIPSFGIIFGTWRIQEGRSATQILGNVCTGSGTCTEQQLGDAMAKFQMGFSNELMYRRVRLAAFVDWRNGGKISSVTTAVFDGTALARDHEDGTRRLEAANGGASVYVMDGGYVKLRELTLSYELPAGLTRALFRGSTVRLEASGRNLATWTKYIGMDPEVSVIGNHNIARGIDLAGYPPARSVFFSVDVGF
ncbi:MAG: SusC/RagA family TonB-linked outer membrane protein [Gemmatimonadaceae bacterium]